MTQNLCKFIIIITNKVLNVFLYEDEEEYKSELFIRNFI